MAKIPDGWVFTPKLKDMLTITLEEKELIRCCHCRHWIPGEIDETDNFTEPRCERHGGGWSSDEYCSNAERREQDA